MTPPLISVIIPVYNGARFIREALDSIAAQNYPAMELLVVDDGSIDDTAGIIEAFARTSRLPVHYQRQENLGPAAARNRGIAAAAGQIIAFQDADDIWMSNKLALQMSLLESSPVVDIVLGSVQFFRKIYQPDLGELSEEWMEPRSLLVFQAALCRRTVFDKVGLLNEALRTGEDMDWFIRAREAGVSIQIHTDLVLKYRRHEHNLTKKSLGNPNEMLGLLKQSLVRKRMENKRNGD